MQKEQKLFKLRKQKDIISEIYNLTVSSGEFITWHRNTRVLIKKIFGENTAHVEEFNNIDYTQRYLITSLSVYEILGYYQKGLDIAKALLESMISEIEEFENDDENEVNDKKKIFNTKKVFIVHGHDNNVKNNVTTFLKEIELDPIILHNQPNEGKTIIEKFEKHADVGYAIILLTPDDSCFSKNEQIERLRARQNVVFEFGYFVGMLGRKRVAG